jgi:adenylosuccinate lyase
MPFKRNPINAENMDSLARFVAALPRVTWDNAAHNLLERTLDDSGNRRIVLPDTFLASDELLQRALRVLKGLHLHEQALARNLAVYGTFAATERLLMELVRAGANRQEMHERIREHAMVAWQQVWAGERNPLAKRLAEDPELVCYLPPERIWQLLDAKDYIGDAPERALRMAAMLREHLSL